MAAVLVLPSSAWAAQPADAPPPSGEAPTAEPAAPPVAAPVADPDGGSTSAPPTNEPVEPVEASEPSAPPPLESTAEEVPTLAAPPVAYPVPRRRDSIPARIKTYPDLRARYRSAKSWAIGGGVTAGVGVIIALTGVSFFLDARAASPGSFKRRATTAGFVSVGIGGVLLATGAAVLAVGLVKRKNVINDAKAYPPLALVPYGDRRGGGLSLRARF